MAIYQVHMPRGADAAAAERARFLRDGFSWPAFLFGPLWLLWRGLWRALALWLVGALVVGWAVREGRLASADATWLYWLIALFLGFEASRLAAAALERRGYPFVDVAEGGRTEAERSFFSRRLAQPVAPPPASRSVGPAVGESDVIGLFPKAGG